MAADGSVIIVADIDDKKAQRELNSLAKKIEGLNDQINQAKSAKMPLLEQAKELGAELDAAKAKLFEMQEAQTGTYDATQISDQKENVKLLQTQWDAVQKSIEGYDRRINKATESIELAETRAGRLAANLVEAGDAGEEAGERTSEAMEQVNKRMDKLGRRISGLIKRVFFFSLITAGLRSMREWLSKAVKSNDDATAAIGRLKGALLTLAQPIITYVIPVFIKLVNVITRVITAVASFVSMISGKTLQQSADAAQALYEEQNAIEGVGSAAKEANKYLAPFDELNTMAAESAGGVGGTGSTDVVPTFDFGDQDSAFLDDILEKAKIIGAVLAGWKLGSALGLDLTHTLGLMAGIYGVIQFIDAIFDMWENGVSFDNLKDALLALALAALGLGFALGPVAAGIALIVGGLALLVVGIRDAMENGMNWANTLTVVAGLLAGGLGIAILTGSWLPLLIAGLAGALLALVMFTGNGEELMDGLRDVFGGFIDFITGAFSGDWEKAFAGLKRMGEGFKKAWGAIVKSIKDAWQMFVDWFEAKTNGKFRFVIEQIERFVAGLYQSIKQILSGIINFVAGIFTLNFDRALKGLGNIIGGLVNGAITMVEGCLNGIVSGINSLTTAIGKKLKITVPDWIPEIGGKSWSVSIPNIPTVTLPRVPMLAQGAVIPPNREFMAVLGDQRRGTNIEAPESLIRQIMREESGGANAEVVSLMRQMLEYLAAGQVIEMDGREFGRATARSVKTAMRTGAIVL